MVMFIVSFEQMLMAVWGSEITVKSSPGIGLLSWNGLFFICVQSTIHNMKSMLKEAGA